MKLPLVFLGLSVFFLVALYIQLKRKNAQHKH
jgi:hypothetical protein